MKIEYPEHGMVVLTNEGGDTYTSKSEELMDFLHGVKPLDPCEMEFDLEYKLKLFREIESENFDANGKRYTNVNFGKETSEMMLQLINELESALAKHETNISKAKRTFCVGYNKESCMFRGIYNTCEWEEHCNYKK